MHSSLRIFTAGLLIDILRKRLQGLTSASICLIDRSLAPLRSSRPPLLLRLPLSLRSPPPVTKLTTTAEHPCVKLSLNRTLTPTKRGSDRWSWRSKKHKAAAVCCFAAPAVLLMGAGKEHRMLREAQSISWVNKSHTNLQSVRACLIRCDNYHCRMSTLTDLDFGSSPAWSTAEKQG